MVLGFYEDKDRRPNSSTDVLRTEPSLVVDATVNSTKLQWLNRVSFGNIVRSLVDKRSALKLADNSNKWRWA